MPGEIAEMMIGGAMCPCGEYLFPEDGDGPGFPQYCSAQCAADYGGLSEEEYRATDMSDDDFVEMFPKTAAALEQLKGDLFKDIDPPAPKCQCPKCGRILKNFRGYVQHWRDKHLLDEDVPFDG